VRTLLLFAALQSAPIEPVRFPPVDECGGDPSFVEYRRRLTEVVAHKDAWALRSLIAYDIMVDFGPGRGWAKFAADWGLGRATGSELWNELAAILQLGCENLDGLRVMPGNFSRLAEVDGVEPVYVSVGKRATLRSQPDDSAPIVLNLDYHLLYVLGETANSGWVKARISDGRSGYVLLANIRSSIDYRAAFEKRDGNWVMTSFVAGD
jgi:hypothetical protein